MVLEHDDAPMLSSVGIIGSLDASEHPLSVPHIGDDPAIRQCPVIGDDPAVGQHLAIGDDPAMGRALLSVMTLLPAMTLLWAGPCYR
jgi:hypothetical protein